jgi:glycosyltransferase involved in cell wall biosynthesis
LTYAKLMLRELAQVMALRFSVVIPTLNRREMLRTALASVRAQRWTDTQVIVVDGGSNDGTLDELADWHDIQVISGPDAGVYDAFNKGIALADGDVVGILNSDDCYEPGAFAVVANALTDRAHAVCGTALVVSGDDVVTRFDCEDDKRLASPRTTLIGSCATNARFFRREAMARIGPFSLDYKYVSDRDWLTRWYEAGFVTIAIPFVVYRYGQHPGSLTMDADRRRELVIREEMVRLARRWRNNATASSETRDMAVLLEGRCIGYLVLAALRQLRFDDARRWLFGVERPSADPIISIIRAVPDWVLETPTRLRRRRN